LQEVGSLAFGVVELAVHHAGSGAHALHVARGNTLDVAHTVLMRQVAREHLADDLNVTVTVLAESLARGMHLLVDEPIVRSPRAFTTMQFDRRLPYLVPLPAVETAALHLLVSRPWTRQWHGRSLQR